MSPTAILFVAIGLFAGVDPARAAPRAGDTWQVLVAEGKPFGSIHTVVEKEPGGKWSYRRVSRVLIDFLGQREEMNEDFRCTVTDRLEPLSFTCVSRTGTGTVEIHGAAVDGQLRITMKRPELTIERRIPLADKPIFGVCLVDALRARRPSDDSAMLSVIEAGS